MADDYELLPSDELDALRKEVDRLKKSPYPDSKENETLLDTMKALTTSINKLIKIFEGAQDDLIKEYSESSPGEMLKQISEQNAKIAEGIVTVASMLKSRPAQPNHPLTSPQMNVPQRQPVSSPSFDPSTKIKPKNRKGLFENFKK